MKIDVTCGFGSAKPFNDTNYSKKKRKNAALAAMPPLLGGFWSNTCNSWVLQNFPPQWFSPLSTLKN